MSTGKNSVLLRRIRGLEGALCHRNGYDLTQERMRDQVTAEIEKRNTDVVLFGPPCTKFTFHQRLNNKNVAGPNVAPSQETHQDANAGRQHCANMSLSSSSWEPGVFWVSMGTNERNGNESKGKMDTERILAPPFRVPKPAPPTPTDNQDRKNELADQLAE